jgi:hypothetical protein
MIQAITETAFNFHIQTEDNRIDTSVASTQIRHLFKFTNDLDKSVHYAYPVSKTIYDRYTVGVFGYNAKPNVYAGTVNLLPAGYWKYEVYEVSWEETVVVSSGNAPANENDVIVSDMPDEVGIVQGLVTKGKMYVAEKDGTEQVQYVQSANSVISLTIVLGGGAYSSAPTITITGDCITQATATCTISAGVVNSVTITNAGSGYTEIPTVTLTGGTTALQATIVAAIKEENYIYYGQ